MKNIKTIITAILLLFMIGNVMAQPSQSFKNAASAATKKWNNKNLKCKEYARTLGKFLENNADDFGIDSYDFYELKAKGNRPNIIHDGYSTGTPISVNGIHVIAIIDGEVFDNHHPKGANKRSWESELFCVAGNYPSGFTKTRINNIQSYR